MSTDLTFDTEESFAFPNGVRKTLNQIFDAEHRTTKVDESLRYASPKPEATKTESLAPMPAPVSQTQSIPWSTRLAKIVVGFKNGESVGRVGVAILSNIESAYRVIVYKTKTNLLATLTVLDSRDVPYMHRQNCYWQFYDDVGFYWSLLFERATDEADFINKLQECRIRIQLDVDVNSDRSRAAAEETKRVEPEKSILKKPPAEKSAATNRPNNEEETSRLSDDQKKIKAGSCTPSAKLMAHLLKIGGQQLPRLGQPSASANSDSNETLAEKIERCTSVTVIGQPANTEIRKQYILPTTQSTTVNTASSSSVFSPVEAQVMQLMLVENRTQNTELRINMDKLEAKIEKVIDKIALIHANSEQDDELFKLEEKILALKKENRRLKREGKNPTNKTELVHENVYSIYGSELTNLGIDIDPSRSLDTDAIIGELIDRITSLQIQLQDKESQLKSITTVLREQKERNQHEKRLHTEVNDELEQAQQKIKMLQLSLDKKKENEAHVNARLNELKLQHSAHLNKVKVEMTETLKDIMNTLYHNLAQNIVSMEKLVPDKVLALIGRTIRQDTLSAVMKMAK